jgi:hypothetical protein
MPLHIYEGKGDKLISTILQPGKRPSDKEIVAILIRIFKKIRQAWPKVGILIRGGSYYSAPAVYDFCDHHDIKYVFGFNPYKSLRLAAVNQMTKTRELSEHSNGPVKIYGEI